MTTSTTIVELRSTLLQVPWRGKPPAAGILSAPFRDLYVLGDFQRDKLFPSGSTGLQYGGFAHLFPGGVERSSVSGAQAYAGDLTEFELGEAQTPPALGSAYQRTKHQFENRLLAEAVRNDLQPPTLFDKETFKQVRRARGPAMRDRQPQMRDTGLEVILEAGDRGRQGSRVIGADAIGELACNRP